MRIEPHIRWTARRAGGLFLGVRYSFPCSVCGELSKDGALHFTLQTLQLGFILFTVSFEIVTDVHYEKI